MSVARPGPKIAGLLLFTAVCVGIFLYLFQAAGGKLRLSSPYQVTVEVPNAFQLVQNADVRRAGVKIGVVNDIKSDGRIARVDIELEDDQAPLYRNARALVRTKTLVGENYLELEPGTPAAGEIADGGRLPVGRAEDAVQLDQILSAMDARTRAAVRANLQNIGGGLRRRGTDLNRLLGALRPTVETGGNALAVLDRQRGAVAGIVRNTGAVMQAIGDRRQDVRTLATSARRTAQAVAARDDRVRELFAELPSTLEQTSRSATRLGAFSNRATPVARDLRAAARDLGPVVADLGPTAVGARNLLRELGPALTVADPLLQELGDFSGAAAPAVGALDDFLRQADPALSYLKRYDRELAAFFSNVGSALDTRDAVGNVARVHLLADERSFGGLSASAKKALDALIAAGGLTGVRHSGTNTYPAPGTVGRPQDGGGTYPRLQSLSQRRP